MKEKKIMELKSIFNFRKNNGTLKGKYVLITGAAQGIGLETAIQFASTGCHLILADVNQTALESARQKLQKYTNIKVFSYCVDVSDKNAVQKFAEHVQKEIGKVDILINNAGIGYHSTLEETTLETWKRLIDINIWGTLYHLYAFLPMMKERGKGHIVNVSSGQAFFQMPSWGAYTATKLAIAAMSNILHYELSQYNIKVTTVYPYMVNTGFYNDVEGKSFGSKLSMKLLPLYSQKPETVAKIIFKAVEKGKRIEMVNVLNNVAKGIHFLNPVSSAFSKTVNFALNGSSKNIRDSRVLLGIESLSKIFAKISSTAIGNVGFKINEVMSGEHEFVRGKKGKLPMEFNVEWGPKNLVNWANPFEEDFLCNDLEGTVTVGGLCENAPCKGRLELNYFSEQKIRYTFNFEVDGQGYEYIGEKRNIYPWNLPYSHTCCFGELRKAGSSKIISNSITHFYWDTLLKSLGSFELTRERA